MHGGSHVEDLMTTKSILIWTQRTYWTFVFYFVYAQVGTLQIVATDAT